MRSAQRQSDEDAGSGRLIVLAWPILIGMAIWLAYQTPEWALAAGSPMLVLTGIGLMLLGGWLRRICMDHLGDDFTGFVQTRPDQALVTTGPYRLVRHPSYLGAWLVMTGLGVAIGNAPGLVLLTLFGGLVYLYRARVEERALSIRLGPAYRDYASVRKRFIPFLY